MLPTPKRIGQTAPDTILFAVDLAHGVEIDRSTLANWVGGACWWLEPLQARLAAHVFASSKLFADDTPIPVLDPGRHPGEDLRHAE